MWKLAFVGMYFDRPISSSDYICGTNFWCLEFNPCWTKCANMATPRSTGDQRAAFFFVFVKKSNDHCVPFSSQRHLRSGWAKSTAHTTAPDSARTAAGLSQLPARPSAWNSLPGLVRDSNTTEPAFRRLLKHFSFLCGFTFQSLPATGPHHRHLQSEVHLWCSVQMHALKLLRVQYCDCVKWRRRSVTFHFNFPNQCDRECSVFVFSGVCVSCWIFSPFLLCFYYLLIGANYYLFVHYVYELDN